MVHKVAVIGAGIVGLSTAINIQHAIPGCDVTVMADCFTDLTSHGAAGMVRPELALMDGLPTELARQWVVDTWDHFDQLVFSSQAAEAGITLLSGYHFWDTGKANTRLPLLSEEISYHFHRCSQKELSMFPGKKYENGIFFTGPQVECTAYLPWLTKRFKWGGGRVIERKITSFDELTDEFDIVANCTGLRSLHLQKDPRMTANRGQMFRVKAPWIKHFIYIDSDTWVIPCLNDVVVGGTRQHDDFGQDIRANDSEDVWQRAVRIVPSLQKAEVLNIWSGLRPKRNPVRVEVELLPTATGTLKVVHNYGHGGMGVALGWGTAVHAARLVRHLVDGGDTTLPSPPAKL